LKTPIWPPAPSSYASICVERPNNALVREIADRLFIAEETVKVHVKHIMSKLGASDRTQSVTIAARRGIIHL
jgi:FixJ family two-component response regulator